MINHNYKYAVVGASTTPEKYGYKVLEDLHLGGYRVVPVNPKGERILDMDTFKTISEITDKPDVVIMVVPPDVVLTVLKEVKALGITNVWMQPGSESEEAVKYCEENGISYITNACIMVQRKLLAN